jgi:hypothetical protein
MRQREHASELQAGRRGISDGMHGAWLSVELDVASSAACSSTSRRLRRAARRTRPRMCGTGSNYQRRDRRRRRVDQEDVAI